jgi:hypothetical protein
MLVVIPLIALASTPHFMLVATSHLDFVI